VPVRLPGAFGDRVREQCAALADRHRLVTVALGGLAEALAASPVPLSSMGRDLPPTRSAFLAAAAAGRHAVNLLG